MNARAAVALAIAIYLPILGRLVPALASLPTNLTNYGLIVAALTALSSSVAHKTWRRGFVSQNPALSAILGIILAANIVKALMADLGPFDTVQQFRNNTAGVLYGVFVGVVFASRVHRAAREFFIDKFAIAVSILLLVQGTLSILESYSGTPLADYSSETLTQLERRDMVAALGFQWLQDLGLRTVFTGLMGQHNRFGGMLIVLNLLFLLQLVRTRRAYYAGLVAFCLFLSVGNTTRTSIVALALSDVIVLPTVYFNNRWRKIAVGLGLVGLVLGLSLEVLGTASAKIGGTDSMFSRLDFWRFLLDRYRDEISSGGGAWTLLTGMDYEATRAISYEYSGVSGRSFENDFVGLMATYGVLGICVIGTTLGGIAVHLMRRGDTEQPVLLALMVSLLVSSATLDLNLRSQNLPLIVLVWLGATQVGREAQVALTRTWKRGQTWMPC
jgi:hypothetical protein